MYGSKLYSVTIKTTDEDTGSAHDEIKNVLSVIEANLATLLEEDSNKMAAPSSGSFSIVEHAWERLFQLTQNNAIEIIGECIFNVSKNSATDGARMNDANLTLKFTDPLSLLALYILSGQCEWFQRSLSTSNFSLEDWVALMAFSGKLNNRGTGRTSEFSYEPGNALLYFIHLVQGICSPEAAQTINEMFNSLYGTSVALIALQGMGAALPLLEVPNLFNVLSYININVPNGTLLTVEPFSDAQASLQQDVNIALKFSETIEKLKNNQVREAMCLMLNLSKTEHVNDAAQCIISMTRAYLQKQVRFLGLDIQADGYRSALLRFINTFHEWLANTPDTESSFSLIAAELMAIEGDELVQFFNGNLSAKYDLVIKLDLAFSDVIHNFCEGPALAARSILQDTQCHSLTELDSILYGISRFSFIKRNISALVGSQLRELITVLGERQASIVKAPFLELCENAMISISAQVEAAITGTELMMVCETIPTFLSDIIHKELSTEIQSQVEYLQVKLMGFNEELLESFSNFDIAISFEAWKATAQQEHADAISYIETHLHTNYPRWFQPAEAPQAAEASSSEPVVVEITTASPQPT